MVGPPQRYIDSKKAPYLTYIEIDNRLGKEKWTLFVEDNIQCFRKYQNPYFYVEKNNIRGFIQI